MDVVGLLNNINDKSDMFAVKTWTSDWTNSFQDNQVSFIDFRTKNAFMSFIAI